MRTRGRLLGNVCSAAAACTAARTAAAGSRVSATAVPSAGMDRSPPVATEPHNTGRVDGLSVHAPRAPCRFGGAGEHVRATRAAAVAATASAAATTSSTSTSASTTASTATTAPSSSSVAVASAAAVAASSSAAFSSTYVNFSANP